MLTTCFSSTQWPSIHFMSKNDSSWSLKKFAVKSIKVLGHAADSIARWTSAPVSLPRFGCLWCVRMRVPLPKETIFKNTILKNIHDLTQHTLGRYHKLGQNFPQRWWRVWGVSSRWPFWVRSLWISPTWYVVHKSFLFETCYESIEVDEISHNDGWSLSQRVKLLFE